MADLHPKLDTGQSHAATILEKRKSVKVLVVPSSGYVPHFYNYNYQNIRRRGCEALLAHSLQTDLKKLDLSGRGLTTLPNYLNDEIEEFNLSNNPLTHSDLYPIREMKRLKKLDLSRCGLKELPSDLLNCSYVIEELNLSYNPFTHLDLNVILRIHSLKKLDLSCCGLKEFPFDLIAQQNWLNLQVLELQELNLSNNFLEHQDLLEELNRKKKFSFFNPIRIIFEDAIYIMSCGVWIKEEREDAAFLTAYKMTPKTSTKSPKVAHEESPQACSVPSGLEDARVPKSSNKISQDVIHRCELFEKTVETLVAKKLEIVKNPKSGKATMFVESAGQASTVIYSLVGGIIIAVSITAGCALSFTTAVVTGAVLAVKVIDKRAAQAQTNIEDEVVTKEEEKNVSSYFNCVVKDVAKELSRIFEYQLLQLKGEKEIKILAQCAVNLMLDLENDDIFDRNTLLKKVLQDGNMKKKKIATKTKNKTWSAPDVFRKPGLRRIRFGKDGVKFEYFVKQNGACDVWKYGYRCQFLELKKFDCQNDAGETPNETRNEDNCAAFCKECSSNYENYPSGHYFSESDIDAEYTDGLHENSTYYPVNILLQCPNVLDFFQELQEKKPPLATFLKKSLGLPKDHIVHPVYRPHSPGKVSDLQKSDFTGSDFSHCDFTYSCLENCDFTQCVMLFTNLVGAKFSGSKFRDTFISHSNLMVVIADRCEWTKTSLLYSRVDGAHMESVESSIAGNCLEGTNICDTITTQNRNKQESQEVELELEDELEDNDGNEGSWLTSDNSIIVDQKGGCFRLPEICAFLLFPPNAVDKKVTLNCSRVKYKECQVEPSGGEVFVSQILRIEPEGMTFKKPVTVLLSHSLYEDQDFLYFYELVVENLSPHGCQELKTERISSIEDIPKEISNKEILDSYLPFAKTTIHETCTLVAAARIKSEHICIATNEIYTFFKQYGNAAQLKITFPAGVTEEPLSLRIQLFPADAVLFEDVRLNKNLVYGPVIRVSGQTKPFLKAVDVELIYSHSDVVKIKEDFLPVSRETIQFTTVYGLLMRSLEAPESTGKLLNLNESNNVYIVRPRTDQLKFSFSVDHFSDVQPAVKTNAAVSFVPPMEGRRMEMSKPAIYRAVVLAVHDIVTCPTLHAVLAPYNLLSEIEENWKVKWQNKVRFINKPLRSEEPIYFCVPLSEDHASHHLDLNDYTLRFDPETQLILDNNAAIALTGKYMHFLIDKPCNNGENHSTQGDCRAKAPIHIAKSLESNTIPNAEYSPGITAKNGVSIQRIAQKDHVIQSQNEVGKGSPEILHDGESPQGCNVSSNQDESLESSNNKSEDVINRCKLFEKTVKSLAKKKLKMNEESAKDSKGGKVTKFVDDAAAVTTVIVGLASGITIAVSVATFGATAFVPALVTGAVLAVKVRDRRNIQSKAKVVGHVLSKEEEKNVSSYLDCVVKDVAKELSRIFEYQLLQLKGEKEIKILAQCAVKLMLDLKKDDTFDRNTLLKKVLQDGNMKKKKIATKTKKKKWSAPDVFRKPGLRRISFTKDGVKFEYFVKPNGACDVWMYGYRCQFLELKKFDSQNGAGETPSTDETRNEDNCASFCKECSSNYINYPSGHYFSESDIDAQYTDDPQEDSTYYPVNILLQCPNLLDCFQQERGVRPTLACFLKRKLGPPEDHIVHPVYRPHSPGKVSDLQKSDFTGSDFSHCDFTNSSLENCKFDECVMLFAKLNGAKFSGSKFRDTFISHSNLMNVVADRCEWTMTSLLYSRVDGAHLESVVPSIGGNCLEGTNISQAITTEEEDLNCNEEEPPRGRMCESSNSGTVRFRHIVPRIMDLANLSKNGTSCKTKKTKHK